VKDYSTTVFPQKLSALCIRADPGFAQSLEGTQVEHPRREDRGTGSVEGGGVWGGVSFSALVKRSGEGLSPSTENVSKKWFKMASFAEFQVLYFIFQLLKEIVFFAFSSSERLGRSLTPNERIRLVVPSKKLAVQFCVF